MRFINNFKYLYLRDLNKSNKLALFSNIEILRLNKEVATFSKEFSLLFLNLNFFLRDVILSIVFRLATI